MGCDGGTIPKRKEIVKNKDKQPRKERDGSASAAEQWKNCAICDWVLRKPIVAGHWGHLFEKECVIKHLLDIRRGAVQADHLKTDKTPILDSLHKLKDVKELKLKENPNSIGGQASDSQDEAIKADFVCPITGLETNGKYKFVFSWNCGCVVSERAHKEVKNDEKCLVCQTPYRPFDIVVLNPDRKDLERNQSAFLVRKMAEHMDKDDSLMSGINSVSEASTSTSSSTSSRHKSGKSRHRSGRSSGDHGESTSRYVASSRQEESTTIQSDDRQKQNHECEGASTSDSKRRKS